jgi:hypothetical protein
MVAVRPIAPMMRMTMPGTRCPAKTRKWSLPHLSQQVRKLPATLKRSLTWIED